MFHFNSVREWKDYCFKSHKLYLKNKHFKNWINEKEIAIFNLSNMGNKDIKHIRLGVEDAIRTARLHFRLYYGNGSAFRKIIGSQNKKIDSRKLLRMVIEKRRHDKTEQAGIIVINNPIKSSNVVIKDGEALTYVPEGVMIFSFDALKKYPRNFLKRRAKHEALHLLGLNSHHEDTIVEGYNYGSHCTMEYNAPTGRLCGKCRDALVNFWKGLQNATKKHLIE